MLSQQVWVWPAVQPNNNVDQVSCASEGNKKPDRLYVALFTYHAHVLDSGSASRTYAANK
jgi:hypothetical protein